MLNIYKQFFTLLNKSKCKYCLYKNIESVEDNLNGIKDVDILVDEGDIETLKSAAKQAGFMQCTKNYPLIFVAYTEGNKMAMIDVEIKVPVYKPVKYRLPINWKAIQVSLLEYEGLKIPHSKISWKYLQAKYDKPLLEVLVPNIFQRTFYNMIGDANHIKGRLVSLFKRVVGIPAYRSVE